MNTLIRTVNSPDFNGEIGGVAFQSGVGVATPEQVGALSYFNAHPEGYATEPTDRLPIATMPDEKGLSLNVVADAEVNRSSLTATREVVYTSEEDLGHGRGSVWIG